MEGAVGMEMLRNSKPGTAMNAFYYSSMDGNPDAFVTNDTAGFQRLMQEDKILLYWSVLAAMGMKGVVALDTTDKIPSSLGFALQKNSELTGLFDYHLQKMFENGVWERILHVKRTFSMISVLRHDFGLIAAFHLHTLGGL